MLLFSINSSPLESCIAWTKFQPFSSYLPMFRPLATKNRQDLLLLLPFCSQIILLRCSSDVNGMIFLFSWIILDLLIFLELSSSSIVWSDLLLCQMKNVRGVALSKAVVVSCAAHKIFSVQLLKAYDTCHWKVEDSQQLSWIYRGVCATKPCFDPCTFQWFL